MKNLTLTFFFALLLLTSCTEKKQEKVLDKTPEALADGGEIKSLVSRGGTDLVESLYSELAEKDPSLKKLEQQLNELYPGDSTADYDAYNQKNKSYYHSAKDVTTSINDSLLRKKMKALIDASINKYDKRTAGHDALLEEIGQKSATLNDLHAVLKITYTLPLIEQYQKDKLPAAKPIQNYKAQLDKTVKYEESLIKK